MTGVGASVAPYTTGQNISILTLAGRLYRIIIGFLQRELISATAPTYRALDMMEGLSRLLLGKKPLVKKHVD